MLEAMPAEQWLRWQAWARSRPFGPQREDLRAALQIIYGMAPWQKEGRDPLRPSEIFPHLAVFEAAEREESPAAIQARWKAWVISHGGEVIEPARSSARDVEDGNDRNHGAKTGG